MRVTTDINVKDLNVPIIAVCNSHVLVVDYLQGDRLYVYNVSAEHTVRDVGFVPLGQQNWTGLACTRIGKDTYVALSHYETSLVTLHRLVWSSVKPHLDQFANYTLHNPFWLLFLDDLLLVSSFNSTTKSDAIVSIPASDGALSEKRVLLTAKDHIAVHGWAVAGDRLVLWDLNSGDLLIYATFWKKTAATMKKKRAPINGNTGPLSTDLP